MTARMTMPLTTQTERTDREHGRKNRSAGSANYGDGPASGESQRRAAWIPGGFHTPVPFSADFRARRNTRSRAGDCPGRRRHATGRNTARHFANRARICSQGVCAGRASPRARYRWPKSIARIRFAISPHFSSPISVRRAISSRLSVFGRCCCLVAGRSAAGRHGIADIRVNIRPQRMRRHLPIRCLAHVDYSLGRDTITNPLANRFA